MAAPIVFNLSFLVALLLLVSTISTGNIFAEDNQENELLKRIQLSASGHMDISVAKPKIDTDQKKLVVFCYPGQDKRFHRMWINPKVTIILPKPDIAYNIYPGKNFSDVVSSSKASSILSLSLPFNVFNRQEYSFSPFNASCLGIASDESYNVRFLVKNLELWYVLYTLLGLLVFFTAPHTSRNVYLHYGTGVSLGVLSSLLIIVFVFSKFLPQKLKMLGYAIGVLSTSASMFLLRYISFYMNDIWVNNWQILAAYVCVAGLVSFFVVYRYGPVSNPRTLDLIRWTLQLAGLTLVYHSTQIAETSIAIILLALAIYNFPRSILSWLRNIRHRFFPETRYFLSPEEYCETKERATRESLAKLRDYCRSPDCNAWKTLGRLKSPTRFSNFVEGEAHVSDHEFSLYNSECTKLPRLSEDESSDEDSDLSYVHEIIARQHPD